MYILLGAKQADHDSSIQIHSLFVSLIYYAESTVRWFGVREKHC
jgi:hypothetical protein